MDTENLFSGKVLKEIRENKGYTQQEIANHTMSRSNYSKMEKDAVNPNVLKYFAILDYLDMNHNEFVFILNDYELNPKDTIVYKFKTLKQIPDVTDLEKLINLSKEFLDEREDHLVKDIYNSISGYYFLMKEHNLKKANTYAEKVWERLQKIDKFYFSEHFLLNRMLYYFEIKTAVSLTDKALKELEQYYSFQEASQLISDYLLNISTLLIAHEEYEAALNYIEKLVEKSKVENDVLTTGTALVHQAVCRERLYSKKEAQDLYDSAIKIFEVINRQDLIKIIKEAPHTLSNSYAHIEFL